MSASWEGFRTLLLEENKLLGRLNQAALSLTDALVANDGERIGVAEKKLEAARIMYAEGQRKRKVMQRTGFGELTLEQVCAYAPGPMRRIFQGLARELTIRSISLAITVNNNKALIAAGMDRLQKTVSLIQESMSETTGTYRRRGIVPKPSGSVIVSRKA